MVTSVYNIELLGGPIVLLSLQSAGKLEPNKPDYIASPWKLNTS